MTHAADRFANITDVNILQKNKLQTPVHQMQSVKYIWMYATTRYCNNQEYHLSNLQCDKPINYWYNYNTAHSRSIHSLQTVKPTRKRKCTNGSYLQHYSQTLLTESSITKVVAALCHTYFEYLKGGMGGSGIAQLVVCWACCLAWCSLVGSILL